MLCNQKPYLIILRECLQVSYFGKEDFYFYDPLDKCLALLKKFDKTKEINLYYLALISIISTPVL